MLGIFTIIPMIASIISNVETIFGGGNGGKKKDAVVAAVTDILNIAQTVHPNSITANSSEFMAGLAQVIDGIVRINNATGLFKHSTQTP